MAIFSDSWEQKNDQIFDRSSIVMDNISLPTVVAYFYPNSIVHFVSIGKGLAFSLKLLKF